MRQDREDPVRVPEIPWVVSPVGASHSETDFTRTPQPPIDSPSGLAQGRGRGHSTHPGLVEDSSGYYESGSTQGGPHGTPFEVAHRGSGYGSSSPGKDGPEGDFWSSVS